LIYDWRFIELGSSHLVEISTFFLLGSMIALLLPKKKLFGSIVSLQKFVRGAPADRLSNRVQDGEFCVEDDRGLGLPRS
jgi:hypothetical protein